MGYLVTAREMTDSEKKRYAATMKFPRLPAFDASRPPSPIDPRGIRRQPKTNATASGRRALAPQHSRMW